MMQPIATSLLTALSYASVLAAQSVPHVTTLPRALTGAHGGQGHQFPLGRTGGLIQYWYRADMLPLVSAIGVRPWRGASIPARSVTLETTLSNTTQTFATLAKTFTQNLGPLTTIVFTRKTVNLPPLTNPQDPDLPFVWMASDVPFVTPGPHLLVQFDLGTAVGAQSTLVYADSLDQKAEVKGVAGVGSCGGSLSAGTPQAGTLLYSLAQVTPTTQLWLLLGANHLSAGGVSLPFRLDPVGMPGCVLGLEPLVTIAGTSDPAGNWVWTTPIPPLQETLVVYAQVVHHSAQNALNLATSNLVHTFVGAAGLCNYLYNWDRDGLSAQYGPYTYNLGVSLLLKP